MITLSDLHCIIQMEENALTRRIRFGKVPIDRLIEWSSFATNLIIRDREDNRVRNSISSFARSCEISNPIHAFWYRFPLLFAVDTFSHLWPRILNSHITSPFLTRKLSFLTNFEMWISKFADEKSANQSELALDENILCDAKTNAGLYDSKQS